VIVGNGILVENNVSGSDETPGVTVSAAMQAVNKNREIKAQKIDFCMVAFFFIEFSDRSLGVLVADVSGTGVPLAFNSQPIDRSRVTILVTNLLGANMVCSFIKKIDWTSCTLRNYIRVAQFAPKTTWYVSMVATGTISTTFPR
jgi:hypothetical protein